MSNPTTKAYYKYLNYLNGYTFALVCPSLGQVHPRNPNKSAPLGKSRAIAILPHAGHAPTIYKTRFHHARRVLRVPGRSANLENKTPGVAGGNLFGGHRVGLEGVGGRGTPPEITWRLHTSTLPSPPISSVPICRQPFFNSHSFRSPVLFIKGPLAAYSTVSDIPSSAIGMCVQQAEPLSNVLFNTRNSPLRLVPFSLDFIKHSMVHDLIDAENANLFIWGLPFNSKPLHPPWRTPPKFQFHLQCSCDQTMLAQCSI